MERDAALAAARAYFGPRAEAYERSPSHGDPEDLARMVRLLAPARGSLALDVATGGGHAAVALERAGCEVVRCDATREMLVRARVPSAVADAQALPFRDGAFDAVACRIAAHHFPDLAAFVGEVARVLRDGGAFYAFDLTAPDDLAARAAIDGIERTRDPSHVRCWTASEWRGAVERAGLRLERIDRLASDIALEPWLARARMSTDRERAVRALLETAPPGLEGFGLSSPGRLRLLRLEVLARKGHGSLQSRL